MAPTQITDLPIEVLSYIFKFLRFLDLQFVRLVCLKFYTASLENSILERERVVFNYLHSDKCYSVKPTKLMRSKRPFLDFGFQSGNLFHNDTLAWSHLGPKLKSLTLLHCKLSEGQLFSVLSHCTRLKRLEISLSYVDISAETAGQSLDDNFEDLTFDDETSTKLVLESFSVNQQFDPRLFRKILKCSPNLTSLAVDGFAEDRKMGILTPRLDDIVVYLKAHGHQLKELRLMIRGFKAKLTQALSELDNLQLHKFHFNVDPPENFIRNQKNCQEITLFDVSSDTTNLISTELNNLRRLGVQVRLSTATDFKKLTSMENLTSLRLLLLTTELSFKDSDASTRLWGNVNKNRKVLKIGGVVSISVSPLCIIELTKTYPALTELEISGCDGVTDLSVQSIFRHLIDLETLKLCDCRYLTDAGLSGICLTGLSASEEIVYSIARLKRLRKLDLTFCSEITGKAFTAELKFGDLQQLNLSHTTISQENIMNFIKNNPTIECMSLPGCVKYSDSFVTTVLQTLTRLRNLDMGQFSEVSSRNMKKLKKHCRHVECSYF